MDSSRVPSDEDEVSRDKQTSERSSRFHNKVVSMTYYFDNHNERI